jgi:hypothetical protein
MGALGTYFSRLAILHQCETKIQDGRQALREKKQHLAIFHGAQQNQNVPFSRSKAGRHQ